MREREKAILEDLMGLDEDQIRIAASELQRMLDHGELTGNLRKMAKWAIKLASAKTDEEKQVIRRKFVKDLKHRNYEDLSAEEKESVRQEMRKSLQELRKAYEDARRETDKIEKIPIERKVKCKRCKKSLELVGEFEFVGEDGPQNQTRAFKCPYCTTIVRVQWPAGSEMFIRYIPEQM